jgi:hypothetical protein
MHEMLKDFFLLESLWNTAVMLKVWRNVYLFFWARSQNYEKRLLALSMSVRPSSRLHGTIRLPLTDVHET